MRSSNSSPASARPHLRYSEGTGSKFSAELLEHCLQGAPQVGRHLRGEANNNEPAHRSCGAAALQGGNDVAQKLQPRVEMRPKIDERCDGFAIREQRLPVK